MGPDMTVLAPNSLKEPLKIPFKLAAESLW